MYFKNRFTSNQVRFVNRYLPVETTGAQQCTIQYIRAVGSGQYNDPRICSKTIHFNQQLVQCAFPFIIAHHYILSSCTANRIYLINKYDTWGFLSCLLEKIADTAGANTHKHFNEIGTTKTKER